MRILKKMCMPAEKERWTQKEIKTSEEMDEARHKCFDRGVRKITLSVGCLWKSLSQSRKKECCLYRTSGVIETKLKIVGLRMAVMTL